MTAQLLLAGVAVLAVVAYGVLAGADFGGGVWDLFARGPRKQEQRQAIERAMAPVWEANHVWLVFVIVVLFSGFPAAFAALSILLFVPFHLVLVGIILRGAAFVFRAYGPRAHARPWGVIFGAASVVTPVLLGIALGAVSEGHLRIEHGVVTEATWLSPWSGTVGLLALALCSYQAAVFLVLETTGSLRADFLRRALLAGGVVVALSVLALVLAARESPHLFHALWSPSALPVLLGGAATSLASGYCLLRGHWRLARAATVLQVALLLVGWTLAQAPYLIYPDVTLQSASAPAASQWLLLRTIPVGALLLGPSLWLLFRVFKRPSAMRAVEHEGAPR